MTKLTPLSIEGAWLFESPSHGDDRGFFREWFKSSTISETLGREFSLSQSNLSRSKKGVVRGIHFSLAPMGQAKWVTCANGAIWDVVVDIRPNSPTFKRWEAIELRAEEGQALNLGFRHKDYATNVLTFDYAREPLVMADLVLCAPVLEKEAQEQGKDLIAHYAHMLVHGVLHAQGYDHERLKDAQLMEALEVEILSQLGFDNPY